MRFLTLRLLTIYHVQRYSCSPNLTVTSSSQAACLVNCLLHVQSCVSGKENKIKNRLVLNVVWDKCVGRIVTKSMSYFLRLCDCSALHCATL